MNINNEATHAATEQRKRTFRSRALKWSSQDGSLGAFLAGFSSPCRVASEDRDIAGDVAMEAEWGIHGI